MLERAGQRDPGEHGPREESGQVRLVRTQQREVVEARGVGRARPEVARLAQAQQWSFLGTEDRLRRRPVEHGQPARPVEGDLTFEVRHLEVDLTERPAPRPRPDNYLAAPPSALPHPAAQDDRGAQEVI